MEFKDQIEDSKLILLKANLVFGREREEKMGEELGLEEDQVLGGFLPIFLLICDQET